MLLNIVKGPTILTPLALASLLALLPPLASADDRRRTIESTSRAVGLDFEERRSPSAALQGKLAQMVHRRGRVLGFRLSAWGRGVLQDPRYADLVGTKGAARSRVDPTTTRRALAIGQAAEVVGYAEWLFEGSRSGEKARPARLRGEGAGARLLRLNKKMSKAMVSSQEYAKLVGHMTEEGLDWWPVIDPGVDHYSSRLALLASPLSTLERGQHLTAGDLKDLGKLDDQLLVQLPSTLNKKSLKKGRKKKRDPHLTADDLKMLQETLHKARAEAVASLRGYAEDLLSFLRHMGP